MEHSQIAANESRTKRFYSPNSQLDILHSNLKIYIILIHIYTYIHTQMNWERERSDRDR